jgi:hypothetical protein
MANFDAAASGTADTSNNSIATFRSETLANFLVSGLAITTSASLLVTIPSGVYYCAGVRVAYSGSSTTLTASRDSYLDMDSNGAFYVTAVTNGAAAPSLVAGRFRIGYWVSGASTVTSTVKVGFDSLGNVLSNTSPYGPLFAVTPVFSNSWVAYSNAVFGPPRFWKDKTGRVQAAGLIQGGTTTGGTTIFTFPTGYRPSQTVMCATASGSAMCAVDVLSSGVVQIDFGANATYLSLNGISFLAV